MARGNISWEDASSFGRHYRGWMSIEGGDYPECGAQAFRGSLYPMSGSIERHAWINTNARGEVQPIGLLAPGPLGLHDIYGNVSEMMRDRRLGETELGRIEVFVIRGGSRYGHAAQLGASRSEEASIYDRLGGKHTSATGFRVVIAAPAGLIQGDTGPAPAAGRTPPQPPPAPPPATFVGHLQINVTVPARVWVDDEARGEASPAKPLSLANLPIGGHQVRVSAEGHIDQDRTVDLVPGEWTQLRIELDPTPERQEVALALTRGQRRAIQERLNRLGFDAGRPDGIFGPGTRGALKGFQASAGLESSGYLTQTTLETLSEHTAALAAVVVKPGDPGYSDWVKGLSGYGVKVLSNGLYRGQLAHGVMEGHGVFTVANGQRYEGGWKDDKRHGQGRMVYPDGRIEEGLWTNDKFSAATVSAPE